MMASSAKPKTLPPPEASSGLNSTGTNSRNTATKSNKTGTNSKTTGTSSNNPGFSFNSASISFNNGGTSFNNTGINFGQQIGEIKQQYFTTISDETSHKSFAESSFRKYQNLRLYGTCEWLLEQPGYQAWAACKGSHIRISGKVGCGKSTLVARAIEHIQKRETPGSGHKVLYFFASKDVSQGNLRDVDEARLKDLQPTLKNVLLTFWDQLGVDEDGGIGGGATKNLSEAELVDGIMWKLKESKTTHISMLIDAFDALSPSDRGELHCTLLKECKKGKDKIHVSLLTSHTRAGTTPTANGEIHVTTEKNGDDMRKFLRAKLSKKMLQQDKTKKEEEKEEKDAASQELTTAEKAEAGKALMKEEKDEAATSSEKPLQQDEAGEGSEKEDAARKEPKKAETDEAMKGLTNEEKEVEVIVEQIMKRAQEMFLWAAVMLDLVCRAHDKKERQQVLERLLLPKSIQDDYEKLVEGWEGKTARGRLEEWQRKLARQATGLLAHKQGVLSYAALTEVLKEELKEELREAAAQERKAEAQNQIAEAQTLVAEAQKRVAEKVMECCSPFIEYDEDLRIFRFTHPSMHEFFVKRDASRTAFADQTLAYLCRPAFRRGPFVGAEWWDMGELRPFLDSHPFLGFAAANWVEAVRNSKAANGQNRKSTRNLLADLYRSDDNLLLAFQVLRLAAHNPVPAQLRSAHIFSFFGLFDNLFSSSSRFTTVHDAAMTDSDGRNALHWALQANDAYARLQTVRILMPADRQQAADMMAAQDTAGLTPLHYAARQGDLGIVRLMLSRDPDKKRVLDFCSKKYGTPLIMAANHGHVDVVKELIKADANLEVKCKLGNVLHAAAAAPDEAAHACVAVILDAHTRPRRLDVNYDKVGTPLHSAAYHGCESVVKLLLEKGFNARQKSWEHCSTITAAAAGCHRGTDPEPFLRIMEMLHDAGAKAHAAGTNGYFALHHAAQFGQHRIAHFLHNCGAKCDEKSTIGTTPLAVAADMGDIEVVKVLMRPREQRQRAYTRKMSERQKRRAEKERKKKEEKKKKSTSGEESTKRKVVLALWEPVWHSAVAANDMTRIYKLVSLYEQRCDTAIQQKTLWVVKALAPLGTVVFASVVRLMERPRDQQKSQQKSKSSPNLRHKARQVLSSTAKGVLKVHAFCDTTLSYFQLKVHNIDRGLRSSAAVGTEFHPGAYEEILDRLTLAAVHTLSKAFEHDNLDAVPPMAEAWIDALLAIDSVGLLERLVEKRAQALKTILTDTTKTVAEKRHDAGILAKVGIELLAVALRRSHREDGDAGDAARLASSLAKLWASALHDAGGPAADATRVEDIYYVCGAFLDMFEVACKRPSSRTSDDDDRRRSERVCLLAQVGAEIVVEAVRTDNEPLINNMRRMMDLGRKAAATAGLKDDVEKVLMEKHDSLKKAGSTAPAREKRDSVISGQTTPVQNKEMSGGIGGKDVGGNGTSNVHDGDEHEGSEGSVDGDESSEDRDGKLKTDEELEKKRLRITLRILRGDEGVITKPQTQLSLSKKELN